jgi:Zn-dependent protease with chaperone function
MLLVLSALSRVVNNVYSHFEIGFLMNMFSRHNEFQADAFSTKLGYGRDLRSGFTEHPEILS